MKELTGYGAYQVFVTVRTHFRSRTFDMFKHHNTKAGKLAFDNRPDKWCFDRLSKEYGEDDLIHFFVSNRLEDRDFVTELMGYEAKQAYERYTARRQSLTYHFTNQLDILFKTGLSEPFHIKNGNYPSSVSNYLGGILSSETMVIVNDFIPFMSKFDKEFGPYDPLWPKISLKLHKYRPFVHYDRVKIKSILKDKVGEYGQAKKTKEIPTKE